MKYLVRTDQIRQLSFQGRVTIETTLQATQWTHLHTLYENYNNSYDIFRASPEATRILCSTQLGYIAKELFKIQTPLFVAFTLYPIHFTNPHWEVETPFCNLVGGFFLSATTIEACLPTHAPETLSNKWLVAFASTKTRYQPQKNEPLSNLLKSQGCASGDLLNPDLHPRVS